MILKNQKYNVIWNIELKNSSFPIKKNISSGYTYSIHSSLNDNTFLLFFLNKFKIFISFFNVQGKEEIRYHETVSMFFFFAKNANFKTKYLTISNRYYLYIPI